MKNYPSLFLFCGFVFSQLHLASAQGTLMVDWEKLVSDYPANVYFDKNTNTEKIAIPNSIEKTYRSKPSESCSKLKEIIVKGNENDSRSAAAYLLSLSKDPETGVIAMTFKRNQDYDKYNDILKSSIRQFFIDYVNK